MQQVLFQRVMGMLLALTGVTHLLPTAIAWGFGDSSRQAFTISSLSLMLIGALLWWPVRQQRLDLRLRDGFLVVAMSWLTVVAGGTLPMLLLDSHSISWADAFFESMSGLTTTGATVLTGLDNMPQGLLMHRALLQWLGGMGIIVLAVAILPMLRIGGMQLYRAETPGPMKDSKLTPRITETAKALWMVYLGLTLLCALAYWSAGMNWFDAICHSFTTIPTGGYSNYDASVGHFNSPVIEMIAILFMVIGGINFALHYLAWRRATTQPYQQDAELKTYLALLLGFGLVAAGGLFYYGIENSAGEALRHGLFMTVSAMTSTGYTLEGFYLWPGFLPIFFIFIVFIGGCAGSTGGGMKVVRVMLLYKQSVREIQRVIHPSAVATVKLNGRAVESRVISAVWAFFFIYMATYAILSIVLAASGLDLVTAFSAVAACLTQLGPSLGKVGPHYADISDFAKVLLSFAMLLGRLEIFTLLVLFTPAYWKDA
ncbi:MAG: TrkH family potassium uptake protein [Wenzhouxiangellaceae bacterium]